TVNDGERCGSCGEGALSVTNVIEVGHIFKLGTKYSQALGANVLDETGRPTPIVMGSYGIGVGRAMAAVVEVSHDDRGIIWPVSVAPFTVVITLLRPDNPGVAEAGDRLYRDLVEVGLDVLLDDRKERPGVKFADSELIGIPYRLTVGPRGLEAGEVELTARDGSLRENLPILQVTERLVGLMS
ncbi:MAG: proline--tRNA ligase, partial [Acidimicrobiia bacterium]|nr:proline--tRNA ligase [Acidimicrobiia bacterium]